MNGVSARELLGLPVRLHGIQLGRPIDLILDRERRRVLGFDVRCGDDERRFLPLAAIVREAELAIVSPLVLLAEAELAFYTERGSTFAALRGSDVVRRDDLVGVLEDVVFTKDGPIVDVVVETADGPEHLPYDEDIAIGRSRRSVRAAS